MEHPADVRVELVELVHEAAARELTRVPEDPVVEHELVARVEHRAVLRVAVRDLLVVELHDRHARLRVVDLENSR